MNFAKIFIFVVLCALFTLPVIGQEVPDSAKLVLRASGRGIAPADAAPDQAEALARRAAELAAQQNLAVLLQSFVSQEADSSTWIEEAMSGFVYANYQAQADGSVAVEILLPLSTLTRNYRDLHRRERAARSEWESRNQEQAVQSLRQLQSSSEEQTQSSANLHSAQEELTKLKETCQGLEGELAQSKEHLAAKEGHLVTSIQALHRVEEKLQAAENQCQTLQSQLAALQHQDEGSLANQIKRANQEVMAQMESLQKKVTEGERELAQTKEQLADLRSTQQKDLQRLTRECSRLREAHEAAKQNLSETDRIVEQLALAQQLMQKEIQALKKAVNPAPWPRKRKK